MRHQFVVVQKEIHTIRVGKIVPNIVTLICTRNNETGMVYPHPVSNFIKEDFNNNSFSINSQKKYAEDIKKFLNFVLESIQDEDEEFLELYDTGIKGLQLIHGAKYLTFLTERVNLGEIKPNYVFDADRILTKFFTWLSQQNIIYEKFNVIYEWRKVGKESIQIAKSPFRHYDLSVEYPRKESNERIKDRKLHDFGNGRLDLVNLFIRIAELEAPDIALGIAFQFYGGLRRGEVINLMRSSVKEPTANGSGTFTLNIKDNWKSLFSKKKHFSSRASKKGKRASSVQSANTIGIVPKA